MRAPGEILLISCYELGHQPFGLALPLGFLERAGYAPAAMDIAVEPLDEGKVSRARFVGISVPMHTALRLGVRVAERVRALNPACHICMYGLYASLNADYLLAHGADSVIGGEVESRLVALVEALERRGSGRAGRAAGDAGDTAGGTGVEARGTGDSASGIGGNASGGGAGAAAPAPGLPRRRAEPGASGGAGDAATGGAADTGDARDAGDADVPGVACRGRPARPVLERLSFAVPSRRALPPLDRYAWLERGDGSRALAGYVEASRGCLHHCLHCPIPPVYGGRFFVLPRETVLEDIRRQVAAGAAHITFGDPDFLNGPGHSMQVVRALHAEFPEVTFDITAKIEHVLKHRALFPELAGVGCAFVVSAVESLNDEVLGNLEKGHTRADVVEALAVVRGAGIALRPSFVPFTPWETLESYLELFDFVEREGLIDAVDPVQYTIRLLVPPGSALLGRPAIHPFLEGLDEAAFTYRWTHPDPRMDALHREVSAAVEAAAAAGEDPAVTFHRLRAMARAAAGGWTAPGRLQPAGPVRDGHCEVARRRADGLLPGAAPGRSGRSAVGGREAGVVGRPTVAGEPRPGEPEPALAGIGAVGLPPPDRPKSPRLSEPWFC